MNTETQSPHPVGSSAWLGADKMSAHWPPSYRGRIPVKVRMACDLGPDMWGILGRGTPRHWVKNNDELPVKVNQHGAMSVVTPYGDLGVKPLECEIIEWRAPNVVLCEVADKARPN
jgi:hypothetical protein